MAKITDFHQLPDGLLGLSCVGRAALSASQARSRQADGLQSRRGANGSTREPTVAVPARHARLPELLRTVLPQLGEVYTGIEMRLDDAAWVGHRLAEILPIPLGDKQIYLEIDDPSSGWTSWRRSRRSPRRPRRAPTRVASARAPSAMAAAHGSTQ